jgi:hypothetical protein
MNKYNISCRLIELVITWFLGFLLLEIQCGFKNVIHIYEKNHQVQMLVAQQVMVQSNVALKYNVICFHNTPSW